jgi:hypothetical protein
VFQPQLVNATQPATTRTSFTQRVLKNAKANRAPALSGSSEVLDVYDATIKANPDISFDELKRKTITQEYPSNLNGVSPRDADFYALVSRQLALTPDEQNLLNRQGVVQLERREGRSMAQQYHAIYVQDLPVLVTTDSILDALHRSYDYVLETLEVQVFSSTISEVLTQAHQSLSKAIEPRDEKLKQARCDASLYLAIALDLLGGWGTSVPKTMEESLAVPRKPKTVPLCGAKDERDRILALIENLQMQLPDAPCTPIFGSERCIDYSQFRPRGHYHGNAALERYFRSMMWLGREDTGFRLTPAGQGNGLIADAAREARAASLLTFHLARNSGIERLERLDKALSALVGQGEFLGPKETYRALKEHGFSEPQKACALGDSLAPLLASASPRRKVRSQIATPTNDTPNSAPFEATFQFFGQRFLVDSMVLSRVVYDSVKARRLIPSSLDVMAALGNNEALSLLEPEITKFRYAPQLFASRRAIDAFFEKPQTSFHHRWLSALRLLDDVSDNANFPKVMKTTAWQRKTLQTQLAAWAQVRRDNVLYAAQSYSGFALCDYPKGYVEPYPEFYQSLSNTLESMEQSLRELRLSLDSKKPIVPNTQSSRELFNASAYFKRAGEILNQLEALTQKELRGEAFTKNEETFLRSTIQSKVVSAGCTSTTVYTGWYPELIYGKDAIAFEPVIADVHSSQVGILEEGVGHNELIVAAIDNGKDLALYVGPTYTHYEFVSDSRLTDDEWKEKLLGAKLPSRPSWVKPLLASKSAR